MNQRDEEVDDVIAKLNPNANRRRDSTDSLNFRDSSFDPMTNNRADFDAPFFGDGPKGMKKNKGLIQPVAVDPMVELGKGLGQLPPDANNMFIDEEEQAEEKRRIEEEKKKN